MKVPLVFVFGLALTSATDLVFQAIDLLSDVTHTCPAGEDVLFEDPLLKVVDCDEPTARLDYGIRVGKYADYFKVYKETIINYIHLTGVRILVTCMNVYIIIWVVEYY